MTNKFKAGDKVVRTEHYDVGGDYGFMYKGRECVVKSMPSQFLLEVEGSGMHYDADWFEPIQPAFQAMKFKVDSPEQSKEIQEALFSLGYGWSDVANAGKHHKVKYTSAIGLATNTHGYLLYYTKTENFEEVIAQEFTIKATKSYELIPVVTEVTVETETPEETVELMGQKYSKKELEDALRSLKPIK